MLKEFREFINRGNVMDLAVGVIIGAAFGKIVDSIVGDVLMPIISKVILRGVSFENAMISLDGNEYTTLEEAKKAGAAVIAYGNFIQVVINFVIIAFVLFLIVKGMNKMKKNEEAAAVPPPPPGPTNEEKLLMEIRDALKK
ncbi:MAG: large conductance mechanosensitive channel protein MscL [Flavobacteriales bacterium]|nr:large conductance mechanosensitive channel protein MscL [Flavobacteriales bacterium]